MLINKGHHMSDDDSSSCDTDDTDDTYDENVPLHLWYRARITEPYERACAYGDMDVVRSLVWESGNALPPDQHPVRRGFSRACEHGHEEVVKWLFDNVPGLEVLDYHFAEACGNGHMEVVRELWSRLDPAKPYIQSALGNACRNGHANVVEWALQEDLARILANPEWFAEALLTACNYGHEQIAHRLYDVLPAEQREPVFQMAESRSGISFFTSVCVHLHLPMAQWLYTVAVVPGYIPFRTHDTSDYLLLRVCMLDDAPLAQWLADRYADRGLLVPDPCVQYLQHGTRVTSC
jgi:hypothetical protein